MHEILIIKVNTTLKHNTRAQKCAFTCTKNERYIIKGHPIFEIIRKTHSLTNPNQLPSRMRLQGSNDISVEHLMIISDLSSSGLYQYESEN